MSKWASVPMVKVTLCDALIIDGEYSIATIVPGAIGDIVTAQLSIGVMETAREAVSNANCSAAVTTAKIIQYNGFRHYSLGP
ncbi:hypothetical protein MO867_21140 [Microbulbifer sp. OS29]|uniref:Uncharacterized protein n=1 Tax=Microbulbifer okhotskensis TaxID=2926617 RepID=A0A9X2J6N7_9GAMM|nr:hypothetical protein [Microbulbifer okhotskensis]MCO1336837.1 hypothetical protein [Microbulbifer okhotskensis]